MEIIILTIILIGFLTLYFKKGDKSKEFLLQLNSELRKEIQDIRKEVSNNSEKGRKEIEEKLQNINKGITNFQNTSREISQETRNKISAIQKKRNEKKIK